MIGWLTKQILKHESHDNNKEVKHSKEEEQNLDRENTMITSAMKESIILMIISKGDCA